jgi:hypothetical protein
MPSAYACYRFTAKLRTYGALLAACIERVTTSLRDQLPSLADSAIDGSDMTAYVNGPRYVSKGGRERERLSDPDASWGHRSAVSTRKGGGLRLQDRLGGLHRPRSSARVKRGTARDNESTHAPSLIDAAR